MTLRMGAGRIHTLKSGDKIHLGGRLRPREAHKLVLARGRYGLSLPKWPVTPISTSFAANEACAPVLADVLGNDELGDCTTANSFHLQALRQAAAGLTGADVFHPTIDEVIAIYSRDGGYVPGDESTDQGCDEVTVLLNAQRSGIPSDAEGCVDLLEGFCAIDGSDKELVRKCVSTFVGLTVCSEIPDACMDALDTGAPWDFEGDAFVPNPDNGHCFTILDQDADGVLLGTWGRLVRATYGFIASATSSRAAGALYALLDDEVLDKASKLAPSGLDWAALRSDLASLDR